MVGLVAAARLFDPRTQDEPLGWHKRACEVRRAPYRDQDPRHNRPRCVHGTYRDEPVCARDQFCREFPPPELRHSRDRKG